MPNVSETYVLDASALLCLLHAEAGAERVTDILDRSVIGAVNLSEVVAKLADTGGTEAEISRALGVLRLRVEPFDDEQARLAGLMRTATRPLGLSLGDRACLALARQRAAVAVTTDRAWGKLPNQIGVPIRVVR